MAELVRYQANDAASEVHAHRAPPADVLSGDKAGDIPIYQSANVFGGAPAHLPALQGITFELVEPDANAKPVLMDHLSPAARRVEEEMPRNTEMARF